IVVSEVCKVTFSIGKKYSCEVICEVIDMDVCHLILGRPWQYYAAATHDCRANVYHVIYKKKSLRFLPFNPESIKTTAAAPGSVSTQDSK
ncbi:hypothetical protein, partial [Streptococcus anginosus]|uniref:hypothetical protein n=1 Tax=Streptococcus anginosus TaxID=1328 RepID=UPI002EDA975D